MATVDCQYDQLMEKFLGRKNSSHTNYDGSPVGSAVRGLFPLKQSS